VIIDKSWTIFGHMAQAARLVRHRDGVPVYGYHADFNTPPVSVVRAPDDNVVERGVHIHDFPALWYADTAGLVYVVAPGTAVDPGRIERHAGIGVFFDPAALDGEGRSPWPAWRVHPLLFPFVHGQSSGLLALSVPAERQPLWTNTIGSIEAELAERKEGYRQAVLAQLTLLLIDVARLADDVVGDLRRSGEPLLAEVFTVINRHPGDPLSLRDVARELGVTPGHLTTVVRRRTGRTVQEWIIERRMAEARSLLADTRLPVAEIARQIGMSDPGYFSRLFRRTHGTSPRQWRGRASEVRYDSSSDSR
jgi:AraC-like DNA-binding protein